MVANFIIVYISPNGSTQNVAEALADRLTENGASVALADLSNADESRTALSQLSGGDDVCLLIGSPVYRDMAVPPVMSFIGNLPQSPGASAVPFVTYGGACSGVALWQMAKALEAKGFRIAGAAKVTALHAMMWQSEVPVGKGRPNEADLDAVRLLADQLVSRVAGKGLPALSLEILDYQPAEMAAEFKAKLQKPWMVIPKTVDGQACTQCGICADSCPSGAITLDPLPEFGSACFDCFNCIRLCPEAAVSPAVPLAKIEAMILNRVKSIDERPRTQTWPVPA